MDSAHGAGPAGHGGGPADPVALADGFPQPIAACATGGNDDAGGLVPHDQREGHGQLAPVEVDVGAAHAGELDFDQQLALAQRLWHRELLDGQGFAERSHDSGGAGLGPVGCVRDKRPTILPQPTQFRKDQ